MVINMKKIFFTDLDGTLLNDEKNVTPRTHNVINQWLEEGHILALSSGRPLGSILEVIEKNKIAYNEKTQTYHENLYAIAYNGALIYHVASSKKIAEEVLNANELETIAQIATDNNVYCHAYDDEYILTPRESEELAFYRKSVHLPYKVLPDFPKSLAKPPCKFLFICLELEQPDRLQLIAAEINKVFPDTITCVKSNKHLLEVFSSKSGKGNAVKKLCAYLEIPIQNSLAAGDEQNDLSMIESAGIGIAMVNGNPLLKEKATIITTKTNNEDGLADILLRQMSQI